MHFIESYFRRCETIGAKVCMLKVLLSVFVAVMILLKIQTANARPVVAKTIIPSQASALSAGGWGDDLNGSTNPVDSTISVNKNATAKFASSSSINQVGLEEIKTGTSTESVTVATSANLTAISGDLYLAAISTKARLHLDRVSGLGLTWTLVKKQCAGRGSTSVELWMAMGTPSSNGPVTAHFPAAPSNAVITVVRYSGVYGDDPIGNVVSFSSNGEDGLCTGGTDTDNYSFNLTTTANNAIVYAAVALRSRTHAPGAGYTERAEISEGTPNAAAGIAVMDKQIASASNVAINGALNGITDWSVVAVEIKPQPGVTTVMDEHSTSPAGFQLGQNYPNPFSSEAGSPLAGNPGTQISFSLPFSGKVTVNIYDLTGQLVRTLVEGRRAAGQHAMRWDGRNHLGNTVAAGIYLYQIVAQGENARGVFNQTRRMTFLK